MPRPPKPRKSTTTGGRRDGAGRKPVERYCDRCGRKCPSLQAARDHCR